jgi:PAS domain S-box-containing protein
MTEKEIIEAGRERLAVHDNDLEAALAERKRTGTFRGELTYRRKDGSHVPVEISSRVFTDSDGRTLTSMIVRDITDRKQAEEVRQKARDDLEKRVEERTAELQRAYDRMAK